ncbi:hypothetical protein K461DRAFT_279166 [Myriangium duriaei CBS 260.36]|uniref:Tyrosine specific protein phosphatases domain-containing protein n=1 Tax=Myriangium duriaei CBS 260.36 TaxID=1168546 RepID=A0A9P4J1F2_9PEZI|nr:hypothetical protein K461DRAFT_279166 [Myriangium duriaei CBS 260.36]
MVARIAGVAGTAIAAGLAASWYLSRKAIDELPDDHLDVDAVTSDPGLLKKHSKVQSFTVDGITYPSIRVFYHSHPQADKLPKTPTCLPLLVFIHGLGGSVAQFNTLLTNLVNVGPCLAVDLPGCGVSEFAPREWSAYNLDHFVKLIAAAIERYIDTSHDQKVVLVGHSLGCSLATLLASKASPLSVAIRDCIIGMVAVCPRATALSVAEKRQARIASYLPLPFFDMLRMLDRRGGLQSASVSRFVGKHADQETRRLQLRFNEQSRSAVFLRFVAGFIAANASQATIPGPDIWSQLAIPIFCIAGEDDHVTPATNVDIIAEALRNHRGHIGDHRVQSTTGIASTACELTIVEPDTSGTFQAPPFVFKSAVLPSPAGHGLLYATNTVRIVSGLIQGFLASHVDMRLSIGWQLQHLTTEGKWDVKNLEKWTRINPVSDPIANVFRAMKTLREVDDFHTPVVFSREWGAKSGADKPIAAIIDVSHDSPVYDPKGLEQGGVEYHKFPTVSKLPPTLDEVRGFVALVDRLRSHIHDDVDRKHAVIAVHCHYGFNRTGFFIIAYMIERLGYRLQDALEEFAQRRPPGVRHDHFVNELHVRYAVGLKRAPTWN